MKDQDLLHTIAEFEGKSRYLRYGFERDYYRNLLYKQGHQWIVWDEVARRFRQKRLKPWIPTPVTNKFSSVLDTIASMLLRVEPSHQWSPQDTSDERQRTLAETATKVLDHLKEQCLYRTLRHELATWLTYTGNAYLVNSYDPTGGSKISVPYVRCGLCQHEDMPTAFEQGCPACNNTSGNEYATDEHGAVREEQFTGGRIIAEVASPFEIFLDFTISSWHFHNTLLRIKQRPLSYFERYGSVGKKVTAETSAGLSEFYQSTLPYLASGTGVSSSAVLASKHPGASEYTYWQLPSDEHPDGLFVVATKTVILDKGPLPSKDHVGKPVIPVSQFLFDPIPGSAAGKTVANDLAPKQRQRNELESLIQLIVTRMANPVWIVPYGVDVEAFSGQPGAVLKVFQTAPNAANDPKRLPGENVPSSVMAWLEKIDHDIEDVASTFDVLKGGAPPGVTAGYALQLLTERGQSRWGPLFQRWENGWISWAEQLTGLAREYMPTEQLQALLGETGEWDLQLFKETPLDKILIKVEPGSTKPRSELQEQAQLDNWISKGVINPLEPGTRSLILRSIGLAKYDVHSDWDMKDAVKEEEAFYQIATTLPPSPEALAGAVRFRPIVDNNTLHLWSHKQFAKTDKFVKLDAAWQQVWYTHIQDTAMRVMQEQGAVAPSPSSTPPNQPVAPSPGSAQDQQLGASPQGGHVTNPMSVSAEGPMPGATMGMHGPAEGV